MRGKIVIGVLFVFAILFAAYSVWFVGSLSPVDQRFNLVRQALIADIPDPALLPVNIGDFHRLSFQAVTASANGQRTGSAVYDVPSGGQIQLTVNTVPDPRGVLADWTRASGAAANCPDAWRTIAAHGETQFPYVYAACTATGNTYHEMVWLNNNWLIRVTADSADILLQFANNYPF